MTAGPLAVAARATPRTPRSEISAEAATSQAFRSAMRRLALTVHVVTTRANGRAFGMTATAVCSLTLAPPSILVCVNRSASLHEAIRIAGRFCVNSLGAEHVEVAKQFGSTDLTSMRFGIGDWQDLCGAPALVDSTACVVARLTEQHDCGTHSVFIGSVIAVCASERRPLVYRDGGYAGES